MFFGGLACLGMDTTYIYADKMGYYDSYQFIFISIFIIKIFIIKLFETKYFSIFLLSCQAPKVYGTLWYKSNKAFQFFSWRLVVNRATTYIRRKEFIIVCLYIYFLSLAFIIDDLKLKAPSYFLFSMNTIQIYRYHYWELI